MTTYQCPKGHTSSDADYCSECGVAISAPNAASATKAPQANANICPDCMTPRVAGARYCEVCRFDFAAGVSNPPTPPATPAPVAATPSVTTAAPMVPIPPVVSAPPQPTPPPQPAALAVRLNVVVVTDPSLPDEEEMRQKCPVGAPDLVFPLDLDENLLGRRSDNKKIYPDIDISDPGISHRHLKFIRQDDGSFAVLELGSANGTRFNGADLKPGLMTPINVGDEMIVGMWTRLQIRSR